ncbi:hypothetical protein G9A89_001436 [Geosiphon pyriformis]|nr:hypothetical protein G9A89_001436 [Geosiphon pyriformis]
METFIEFLPIGREIVFKFLTGFAAFIFSSLIYNKLRIGDKRKIPGPSLFSFHGLYMLYIAVRGISWSYWQFNLFPKYGSIVRTSVYKCDFQSMLLSYLGFQKVMIADRDAIKQRYFLLYTPLIKNLSSLEPLMQKSMGQIIQKIDQELKGGDLKKGLIINFSDLIQRCTLEIVGEAAFSISFDLIQIEAHPFFKKVREALKRKFFISQFPFLKLVWNEDPYFSNFFFRLIKNRRQSISAPKNDLLQMLLDVSSQVKHGLTDDKIKEQLMEFLISESDLIAFNVLMTLILLVQHPKKLRKLYLEIDTSLSSAYNDELPRHDNLKNLRYLNAVIKESMRLWPSPLTEVFKTKAKDDIVLGGHLIPKGMEVVAQVHSIHRSTQYWGQDAEEFVPERWMNPTNPVPRDAFYPCGAGRVSTGDNETNSHLEMNISNKRGSENPPWRLQYIPKEVEIIKNQHSNALSIFTDHITNSTIAVKQLKNAIIFFPKPNISLPVNLSSLNTNFDTKRKFFSKRTSQGRKTLIRQSDPLKYYIRFAMLSYCFDEETAIGPGIYAEFFTQGSQGIIAVRGEPIGDQRFWEAKQKALVPYPKVDGAKIDIEFNRRFQNIQVNFQKCIDKALEKKVITHITGVGHGSGGGQPHIGNLQFANYVNSFSNTTLRIFRVTNMDDYVPRLPPNVFQRFYAHTINEIWIELDDCLCATGNLFLCNGPLLGPEKFIGESLHFTAPFNQKSLFAVSLKECNNQYKTENYAAHNGPYLGMMMECPPEGPPW